MTVMKGLLGALLAVQQEAPTLRKDATNPHFKSKYVSLDTIVETIQPLLSRHGLVWTTLPCRDDTGAPALRYRLVHAETGEAIEDVMPLLVQKQDPQGFGSALTYARRYSITAVLNLVADEDDDGHSASQRKQTNGQAPTSAPKDGLPEASIGLVLDAIKKAAMGTEWVRSQMIAVGAQNVPDGRLTSGTIAQLTPEQAVALIKACNNAAEAKA